MKTAFVDTNPRKLLRAADDLLSAPAASLEGRWPLAVAILCRQALEGSMWELWRAKAAGVEDASYRAQLLCLRTYLGDRDLAARIDHVWTALTHACHHHAYELPPTAVELARWYETVEEFVRRVERRLARP